MEQVKQHKNIHMRETVYINNEDVLLLENGISVWALV